MQSRITEVPPAPAGSFVTTTRDMDRFRRLFDRAAAATDYDAAVPAFIRHREQNLREIIVDFQGRELTPQLQFDIMAFPHCELFMAAKFRNGELPYSLKEFCELMVASTPRELYAALEHPVERCAPGLILEDAR